MEDVEGAVRFLTLASNKTCSNGLLLPAFPFESQWSDGLRATLYFLGLIYFFIGVSIIADLFMSAIEVITSKTKMIRTERSDGSYEYHQKVVWNATVSNLTLMALGSSAPEILLSTIEIVGKKFVAGQLGPSTIVGSAAFNLFIIVAVCVLAIPSTETRSLEMLSVFFTTSFFMILAYVWLIIVLNYSSENVITLTEAILTLLFFPLCVVIAYANDIQWFSRFFRRDQVVPLDAEYGKNPSNSNAALIVTEKSASPEMIKELVGPIRGNSSLIVNSGEGSSKLDINKITEAASSKILVESKKSRAWYRVNGYRMKNEIHNAKASTSHLCSHQLQNSSRKSRSSSITSRMYDNVIHFSSPTYSVNESEPHVAIKVMCPQDLDTETKVMYETRNGTAIAPGDFVYTSGVLTFTPGEISEKFITVTINDDDEAEDDEQFYVTISGDKVIDGSSTCTITIIDDNSPGIFEFDKSRYGCMESDGVLEMKIRRVKGSQGRVALGYRTHDGEAVAPHDYIAVDDVLWFENGETEKLIAIEIIDDELYEKDEDFSVELFFHKEMPKNESEDNPDNDNIVATSDKPKKERSIFTPLLGANAITIVTIKNDDEYQNVMNRVMVNLNINMDKLRLGSDSWIQQIKDSFEMEGEWSFDGVDEKLHVKRPSAFDYFKYLIMIFWKVAFAIIVPPTSIFQGYLAFFISLCAIAILTAIIGDLASMFGCVIGLSDEVTAITFVAVGTSIPDLFASQAAAVGEDSADYAIGNITGSNGVNVFLGLGVPWTIAAIYWKIQEDTFNVPAGSLSLSVPLFLGLAAFVIGIILLRRCLLGGQELGGSYRWQTAIALCACWFTFIVVVSLKAHDHF